MRIKKVVLAIALTVALLPLTAHAGAPTDTVRRNQTKLFKLVAQKKTAKRQRELRALFDDMLAYDRFARNSMGKRWKKLSKAQKKRFTGLLTRLIRSNYRRNLKKMLDYNLRYAGEKVGKRSTVVKTRAKHKRNANEPVLEIDFRIAKVDGKLKVIDIITERASLTKTYRSQFMRILKKKGFDKLMEKLEKKVKKIES